MSKGSQIYRCMGPSKLCKIWWGWKVAATFNCHRWSHSWQGHQNRQLWLCMRSNCLMDPHWSAEPIICLHTWVWDRQARCSLDPRLYLWLRMTLHIHACIHVTSKHIFNVTPEFHRSIDTNWLNVSVALDEDYIQN